MGRTTVHITPTPDTGDTTVHTMDPGDTVAPGDPTVHTTDPGDTVAPGDPTVHTTDPGEPGDLGEPGESAEALSALLPLNLHEILSANRKAGGGKD